jgi:hypothetical protein
MKSSIVLALGLCLLPALAGAEMWRWRAADGTLHYSNDAARVPPQAREVSADIGAIGTPDLERLDEAAIQAELEALRQRRQERHARQARTQPAPTGVADGPWPVHRMMVLSSEGPLAPYPNGLAMPSWTSSDQWRELQGVERWLDDARQQLARRELGADY